MLKHKCSIRIKGQANFFYWAWLALFLISCQSSDLQVENLLCEGLENPMGIASVKPRFSWEMCSNRQADCQTAYQILVASTPHELKEGRADLWDSGKILSNQSVWVMYGGSSLSSNSVCYWKVRVWDGGGKPSVWSEPSCFTVGLLDSEDWHAVFIGEDPKDGKPQSPQFRQTFDYSGLPGKCLLHVNSLGYHEAYLNGQPVIDAVLTPAVCQFNKRSLVVTYDVTDLLHKGRNDLLVWLGRGWYVDGFPGVLENGPFVRAELDIVNNGSATTLVATNGSWQVREGGYQPLTSHYLSGERVDGSILLPDMTTETLDAATWTTSVEKDILEQQTTPQRVELNRIQKTWHPKQVKALGDTAWIYDMGINFTGWTTISFPPLETDQQVRISYCDFLDEQGQFRDGLFEDIYVASGKGSESFCNKFNYHAYRFLKVTGLTKAPDLENVTASLIHTDYKGHSNFSCSDKDLNQIHDMIQYTLNCLMIGGDLVDCPHIERLGYGGDGNASTLTAQTMFDLAPTYQNWMQAWSDCMREDGSMPHTAPNPFSAGGGPFWCGFLIIGSWQTYVNYGDDSLLKAYYQKMNRWLDYVESYSPEGLLEEWPATDYRNWYLGDWATPTGIDQKNPASIRLVNNCFIAVCYDTMRKIAGHLGLSEDMRRFSDRYQSLIELIQERCYLPDDASYATGTQIDLVYPLLAGVTPDSLKVVVESTLMQVTADQFKGHLSTGLVGVPIITQWATREEKSNFLFQMLKQRSYPGYLYMIDNGATTTWEHWNGARSHIHNCYNGIGSWFYQALAGIQPDEEQPGYQHIFIKPQMVDGLTWVKASKHTPYGNVTVNWTLKRNSLLVEIEVPIGSTATFVPPRSFAPISLNGMQLHWDDDLELQSGKYIIVCENK